VQCWLVKTLPQAPPCCSAFFLLGEGVVENGRNKGNRASKIRQYPYEPSLHDRYDGAIGTANRSPSNHRSRGSSGASGNGREEPPSEGPSAESEPWETC
jgi:hypothetical protein